MASPHRHDGFYEPIGSVRQPGLQNQQSHQNLHRVQSRHLDNTFMPNNGLYTAEDHASRYDTGRYDTGRLGGSGYQYESSGAQTWNPNSYGGQTSFASISTTGRMKASRQRAALPQVCLALEKSGKRLLLTPIFRDGWIRHLRCPR